jgi:general stress protein 26
METDALLEIARETIDRVPMCMAITVSADGDANARVVQPSRPTAAWSLRFMSDRRTRKIEDIERSGRITLAYQHDAGGAYVALVGRATIIDDVAVKEAIWQPASLRWHPGGPTDPNVVLVEVVAERLEIWSGPHGVTPDPTKGLWAATLTRDDTGWRQGITARRS